MIKEKAELQNGKAYSKTKKNLQGFYKGRLDNLMISEWHVLVKSDSPWSKRDASLNVYSHTRSNKSENFGTQQHLNPWHRPWQLFVFVFTTLLFPLRAEEKDRSPQTKISIERTHFSQSYRALELCHLTMISYLPFPSFTCLLE